MTTPSFPESSMAGRAALMVGALLCWSCALAGPGLDLRWTPDPEQRRAPPATGAEDSVPDPRGQAAASGIAPSPLPPMSFSSSPGLPAGEARLRRPEDFATLQSDQMKMRFRGAQRLDFSYATSKSGSFNVQLDGRKGDDREVVKVFQRWAF